MNSIRTYDVHRLVMGTVYAVANHAGVGSVNKTTALPVNRIVNDAVYRAVENTHPEHPSLDQFLGNLRCL
jgi:hypothetical protein